MSFKVGDKVIYPNQGIGVIEHVDTRTIMGTTCGFYSLRMTSSETTVMVPVDNVEDVGLRRAIGDHEVRRLFTLLSNGSIENHQNWKGRFKENSNKMRTGSLYDVVDVLKSLNHLSQSKNLSFREKRMLDRAKFLVVSELTEVTSEPTEEIEKRVNKALERCVFNWTQIAADAGATKSIQDEKEETSAPETVVVKKKPAKATLAAETASGSSAEQVSKSGATKAAQEDNPAPATDAKAKKKPATAKTAKTKVAQVALKPAAAPTSPARRAVRAS